MALAFGYIFTMLSGVSGLLLITTSVPLVLTCPFPPGGAPHLRAQVELHGTPVLLLRVFFGQAAQALEVLVRQQEQLLGITLGGRRGG